FCCKKILRKHAQIWRSSRWTRDWLWAIFIPLSERSPPEVCMSAARRWMFLLPLVSLILLLVGCGGSSSNSGSHGMGQPPIFTSPPQTAAAQGSAYSYQVAATDPSGGSLTYALTTGPTGASMTGSTVTWTPTAAQSRASNAFTVTATTSEGASGTQSWNVSP